MTGGAPAQDTVGAARPVNIVSHWRRLTRPEGGAIRELAAPNRPFSFEACSTRAGAGPEGSRDHQCVVTGSSSWPGS
jgi:hypothetical protein